MSSKNLTTRTLINGLLVASIILSSVIFLATPVKASVFGDGPLTIEDIKKESDVSWVTVRNTSNGAVDMTGFLIQTEYKAYLYPQDGTSLFTMPLNSLIYFTDNAEVMESKIPKQLGQSIVLVQVDLKLGNSGKVSVYDRTKIQIDEKEYSFGAPLSEDELGLPDETVKVEDMQLLESFSLENIVVSDKEEGKIRVSFNTSKPTIGILKYGENSLDSYIVDKSLSKFHSLIIENVEESKEYKVQVQAALGELIIRDKAIHTVNGVSNTDEVIPDSNELVPTSYAQNDSAVTSNTNTLFSVNGYSIALLFVVAFFGFLGFKYFLRMRENQFYGIN